MLKRFLLLSVSALLCCGLFARNDEPHKNVWSNDKGNVWIKNIPQVSQKRNYCVPAAVSMVTRYFYSKITQKKLAKIFETDSKQGTLDTNFMEAFKTVPELQGFVLKPLYILTKDEYDKMMALYEANSRKKRKRRPTLDENSGNVFDAVNRETARKVFPQARPQLAAVMTGLCYKYINAGIPVLWSVAMNLDPAVKMKGGHMRLIVGYNRQNGKIKKILYRDPWGGSTKFKQVDFEDAQTMTMQLYVMYPADNAPNPATYYLPKVKRATQKQLVKPKPCCPR